jgi:tryptophan synthase alpha chain
MSAYTGVGALKTAFARARAAGRPAFISYITAGDPDLDTSARIVGALQRGGADLIELGVPFSDPIADGEINQRAAGRALRAGVTLRSVLDLAGRLAGQGVPPLILFTYYNPIHRIGLREFARRAAGSGVSGVLVTDLPLEESDDLETALQQEEIGLIHLLSPTSSDERLARVGRVARGFIYLIARTGVTGVRSDLAAGLTDCVRRVRSAAGGTPVAVGFGIGHADQVRALAGCADGVVVGSALVRLIEQFGGEPDLERRIEVFCRELTGRQAPPGDASGG